MSDSVVYLRCIKPTCGGTRSVTECEFTCPRCGDLLDVTYDWQRLPVPRSLRDLEANRHPSVGRWFQRGSRSSEASPLFRRSGVWRFWELLPVAPPEEVLTIGEGQTLLLRADRVGEYIGLRSGCLHLQYEGLNPSGSFKDNGMTAAFTHARMVGARRAACASTGNTSASLALYAAATGQMRAIIFIGSGKIAFGKLAQALDHGALTLQIHGDFDDALERVRQAAGRLSLYLVNSINPFRLEGQKTIMYRVLEGLEWRIPDWIVVPAGNLGNLSAFGKAFLELRELGLIERMPRLAAVNAAGADTLYRLWNDHQLRWHGGAWEKARAESYFHHLKETQRKASTIASAIEINRPVNLPKALRSLEVSDGIVCTVCDEEILEAKARIGAGGLGCEPASAASVAGARKLRHQGVIAADELVVCVLTGHPLKDPNVTVACHGTDEHLFQEVLGKRGFGRIASANPPVSVPNDLERIISVIEART
ncbi:MAG: threonine synthase [Gemmatales bacterium]|nr:threonine synthase [Gemmatales bacterium]MDW8386753.1 threonine synthase [Gemmatales bacterium]